MIAHKIVSKAEGRVRALADVDPGPARDRARRSAHGKDPRHVQVVLDESQELLRAARGVLICVTRHGFVCANAGVDASNAPAQTRSCCSRSTPTRSARAHPGRARQTASRVSPAVVITDSFGRAWRHAQCDVAIGCAGIDPARGLAGAPRRRRTRAARDRDRGRR